MADRTEFWWSETRPDERSLWESKIELGEKFFEEVIHSPVPLDLHILKSLKRSSLGLDLYLWLTYRTFALKAPMRLSWKALYRQFGADPSKATNPRTVDDFRKDCLRELTKIKTAWPGLQYQTGTGVLVVSPSLPCIPPRHQAHRLAAQPFRGMTARRSRGVTDTASGGSGFSTKPCDS